MLAIRLLGIPIVVMGAMFVFDKKAIKRYIDFWMKGNNLFKGGVAAILISVVFLLAASRCSVSWFIALMGIVSLVKGILILMRPEMMKAMAKYWTGKNEKTLPLAGVFAVLMGLLIIYSA